MLQTEYYICSFVLGTRHTINRYNVRTSMFFLSPNRLTYTHTKKKQTHAVPDSTYVSMGNNIFFLQRDVAVSDESPPFPGQLAYTPDNSFHHFSFEQQLKVLPGFYASPGADARLKLIWERCLFMQDHTL